MSTFAATIVLLTGVSLTAGITLFWANRRFRPDADSLVDVLDAVLPQTQCAQCGYPGCRPYAHAMAAGEAINLCPPGGKETHTALGNILASSAVGRDLPPIQPSHFKAVIDESRCIGCYLCIQACPVDAIVGSPQFMHTVLEAACTGCELCISPCPVDCIDLVATEPFGIHLSPLGVVATKDSNACIRCGRCEQKCPVDLLPQELLWHVASEDWELARSKGMDECIECGLCNPVCPSEIDLLGHFRVAKRTLRQNRKAEEDARQAKDRFTARSLRLAHQAANQTANRAQRINKTQTRAW